jgi:hypothetical protein
MRTGRVGLIGSRCLQGRRVRHFNGPLLFPCYIFALDGWLLIHAGKLFVCRVRHCNIIILWNLIVGICEVFLQPYAMRYTSIGFKRTHLEAGFDEPEPSTSNTQASPSTVPSAETPKKKRKRGKPKPAPREEDASHTEATPIDGAPTASKPSKMQKMRKDFKGSMRLACMFRLLNYL